MEEQNVQAPAVQEPESAVEKLNKEVNRQEKGVKSYQRFVLKLLVFIGALWLLFFVFIGFLHMPGNDMYPRLDNGDLIMFYRLDKKPKAQDIIVLKKEDPESAKEQVYVCRVVAVAGDTVEINENECLVVNGNVMIETNIFSSTPIAEGEGFPEYPLTLGAGECFVLADARTTGIDSRYFGPVEKDEIVGTVITTLRRNNL